MNSAAKTVAFSVSSNLADATQPYNVLTSCGHIVIRRMRPSTAGIPFTPTALLHAPNGAPCPDCATLVRR